MKKHLYLYLRSAHIDSSLSKTHLRLLDKINHHAVENGYTVGRRISTSEMQHPETAQQLDCFEDDAIHIILDGQVNRPNVFNTALSYIPPFWHLKKGGVLFNSGYGSAPFRPSEITLETTRPLFRKLSNRLVKKRKSRYRQPTEQARFPDGCIAVFLQGNIPHKQDSTYCTTEAMLRAVVAGANGHRIVVKLHPNSDQLNDAATIVRLNNEGANMIPTDANIHDILEACCVTISFNSAVALEGYLHLKPAILFGKSDFSHIAQTVTDPQGFASAFEKAKARKGGYMKYLYWYFSNFTVSVEDPDLGNRLNDIIFGNRV